MFVKLQDKIDEREARKRAARFAFTLTFSAFFEIFYEGILAFQLGIRQIVNSVLVHLVTEFSTNVEL
jgi:hypothetical protein